MARMRTSQNSGNIEVSREEISRSWRF